MYSVRDTRALTPCGFPHSEIAGSQVVCHLTDTYRRLPRLSSPLTAKASTVCTYSLDHITPNSLTCVIPSRVGVSLKYQVCLNYFSLIDIQPLANARPLPAAHRARLHVHQTRIQLLKINIQARHLNFSGKKTRRQSRPTTTTLASGLSLYNGGASRDRTDDIQLAKLALSQLSYGPSNLRSLAQ